MKAETFLGRLRKLSDDNGEDAFDHSFHCDWTVFIDTPEIILHKSGVKVGLKQCSRTSVFVALRIRDVCLQFFPSFGVAFVDQTSPHVTITRQCSYSGWKEAEYKVWPNSLSLFTLYDVRLLWLVTYEPHKSVRSKMRIPPVTLKFNESAPST